MFNSSIYMFLMNSKKSLYRLPLGVKMYISWSSRKAWILTTTVAILLSSLSWLVAIIELGKGLIIWVV